MGNGGIDVFVGSVNKVKNMDIQLSLKNAVLEGSCPALALQNRKT
jgi:hypothetical protein